VKKYTVEVERIMQKFFLSLPEHAKRRYAAVESIKLGYGGKKYICDLLKCNHRTLERGLQELKTQEILDTERIRRPGAGRKYYIEEHPEINDAFLKVVEEHIAGSPMDENIRWTNMSRQQLADALGQKGFNVSVTVVDQLLKKNNFRRRKAVKTVAGGQVKNRDEQFKNIAQLKAKYIEEGNPVLSMDTKKKN